MRIRGTKAFAWSVSFVVAAVCGTAISRAAAAELARINDQVITLEGFEKKYKDNLKFFQFQAPSKKAMLEDMIKRDLAVQEAKRLGLDKDPDVIERMNTVLYHALLDKQLSNEFEKIHVTDSEAESFYGNNPEIRTSHIFVAVKPGAKAEEEKEAFLKIKKIFDEEIRPNKKSFAEIAQQFSEGMAAPMGGDIDFQTKDKLDPNYYREALKLKVPGKITGIVRTQFGFHIIKLTAVRAWAETDKAGVKRMLIDQRRGEIFEKYIQQLRSKAKVQVNSQLLKD